jgi:hypothetical protein
MGLDKLLVGNVAIALPWHMMGNKESEGKTVVERFRHWGYDPQGHVKLIVPSGVFGYFNNPHYWTGSMINTYGDRHSSPFTNKREGKAWINHYYYQDKEYFAMKLARGRADTGTLRTGEDWNDGLKFNVYE